jgi:hypothetical protein
MGVWAHQDGCEGIPRWVWGHTKMGAWVHQDGCEGIPRWVWGHTKMGAWVHQDGWGLSEEGEEWVGGGSAESLWG